MSLIAKAVSDRHEARPRLKNSRHQHAAEKFQVRVLTPGDEFPLDYVKLRTSIFVEEANISKEPFYSNDSNCSHILIYDREELVGGLAFGAAEDTDFNEYAQSDVAKIKNSVFVTRGMVHPSRRGQGIYLSLLYVALSLYRRQGRSRVVSFSEIGDSPIKRVMDYVPVRGARRRDAGDYEVECIEADINYVMWKIFAKLSSGMQSYVVSQVASDEITFYARAKIKEFYRSGFYEAVVNKTLTKQQYIEVMANTYCYVQWTTRILAGLLGNLATSDVFKEIASHLVEEIGHPEMVIGDLRACGASEEYIDFVINGMVSNHRIDAFMSTQESAVAFRTDPIAFLGVPIAIEGVTAFMPPAFAKALKELAQTWGLSEPQKATTFWLSHLVFDNPTNGHWARIIELLRDNIESERQICQVRNYIDNVIENISAGYSASLQAPFS